MTIWVIEKAWHGGIVQLGASLSYEEAEKEADRLDELSEYTIKHIVSRYELTNNYTHFDS